MNSPKKINYEIRPCKFAERKMLLASFSRLINYFQQEYQYIGFGGLSFTDFKLFHKELNIDKLYSIESGFTTNRLNFNKPFSCIEVKNGESTEILSQMDLSKPSIIWLDYDGELKMECFEDIGIIVDDLPHGSIFVITCNRQLQKKEKKNIVQLSQSGSCETESIDVYVPLSKLELCERFNGLVPEDNIDENCCRPENTPITIRKIIESFCLKRVEERNLTSEIKVKFIPLYNIIYQENLGARMFTYGGIILNKTFDENIFKINDLEFLKTDNPYEIRIPNITYRESLYLNQILDDPQAENELINKGILSKENIKKYKEIYKYMPNFYDVRL